MTEPNWDTPYLHGKGVEEEEVLPESEPRTKFVIFLGDQKLEYAPDEFLKAAWTTGFDTSCSICHEGFDLAVAPPVRLLSLNKDFHGAAPLTRKLPPFTVTNSHLSCLKTKNVKYFPVSHAWHQSIANAYALRVSSPEAARACYEVSIRTLLAVIERFGPDVHLWHDYISIPQWEDKFRGTTILPQIFDIFKESGCAIIHLGVEPPVELMKEATSESLVKHGDSLKRFFEAHWFSRMWPVVEFDRAGEAYIMSSKYEIIPTKFSEFVKCILDANTPSPSSSSSGSEEVGPRLKWISDLPLFVRERQKNKNLGYVFDMISDQGSRSYRDKFIAASELLAVPNYPTLLPPVTEEACLWLAEQQLAANDYSPLLLRPSGEPKYDKARWLKGHTAMAANMWGLGSQTQSDCRVPRVEDHSVHLELELLGNVTNTFSWEVAADDQLGGFSRVLPQLVKLAKGSAEVFIDNLERVYPSQFGHMEIQDWGYHFPALTYRLPASNDNIAKRLENLVQQSAETSNKADIVELHNLCLLELRSLCLSIVSLLDLASPPTESKLAAFAKFGRLEAYGRLCDARENTLITVDCPGCKKTSAFRASLWREPLTRAKLYRIPGLSYQWSNRGGMGMVVENEEVIGRVRFGSSACDCDTLERVKLS